MSADELEAVKCLQSVRFPVCSWDKRFSRSMAGMTTITEKEAPQVWRLFVKYRRQINHPRKAQLFAIAESLATPDLRKVEAARREQERIDAEKAKYQEAMQG